MDEYIDAQWTPVGEPHTIRGNTGTIYTAQEYTKNAQKDKEWRYNNNIVYKISNGNQDAGALRIWQGYGRGTRFLQPPVEPDVPKSDIWRIVNYLVGISAINFNGDPPITIVQKGGQNRTLRPYTPQRFGESER